jgi:phosphoglycolate phosphatase-like HAD superfamily hydrolase
LSRATRGLVLWDIDQTLVDGANLGRLIWGGAFERLTGTPVAHAFVPHGSTDPRIFRDLVVLHELTGREWTDQEVAVAFADAFAAVEAEWREQASAKPAAREAMDTLAAGGGVVQSVLTGNVAANARAKLHTLDLAEHLDFAVGAYGDDPHEVRGDLVAVARSRANQAYGEEFGPADTVLIGDTPRDVEAGRDGQAYVIAVTTGHYDAAALADADRVLADLRDLPAVVTDLLGR